MYPMHWVDCPACGTTEARSVEATVWQGSWPHRRPGKAWRTTVRPLAVEGPALRRKGRLVLPTILVGTCSGCGTEHPARTIQVPSVKSDHEACDARCLNGKRDCSCRCQGRCHGLGSCRCAAQREPMAEGTAAQAAQEVA